MDGMNGMGAGMMATGMIMMLVVLGIAIAGAVWLVRALGDRRHRPVEPRFDEPREILQRRYAAGDIDEEEYFRRISGIEQL